MQYNMTLLFIHPIYNCICVCVCTRALSTSVQFSSLAQSCPTLCDPWTAARQASLSITNCQSLPKPMSIKSVMPSNHLILCCPLLLLSSIFPSVRVFSNESALCIMWPKYRSFNFNISPSNEHPGLISCRMDWLDLFAVQGTLKSLLQHHSSKGSTLRHSAFFIVPLSHPYMTTGKTIALTGWTFVDEVMPLIFLLFPLIFISWRLITLQYCNGFCHTLTWISHGFTCIPHPNPPSHIPLHSIPLGLPSAPGPSTCLLHTTWAGDLFYPR